MKPLVSVLLPVRNGARELSRTLTSLLAQDYPNIEIIVVDDCSIDETYKIAKWFQRFFSPKMKVLRIKNRRMPEDITIGRAYYPRRLAFENSRGEYILDFSIHVTVPEDFVSTYVKEIEGYDMVGCRLIFEGSWLVKLLGRVWMNVTGNAYCPMFRRSAAKEYPRGEDAELNMKIKRKKITRRTYAVYHSQTLRRFLRRMLIYGNARAFLIKRHRRGYKYALFAVPSLPIGYGLGFILGLLGVNLRRLECFR